MEILVDLPEEDLAAVSAIALTEKKSASEVIRKAIELYVNSKEPPPESAFGIWKGRTDEDGVAFQTRVRSEW